MKKAILSLVVSVVTMAAVAQVPAVMNTYTNLATLPAAINPITTSNLVNAPIYINAGYGVGLQLQIRGAAGNETTTSNIVAKVNISMDGTNWLTTAPYSLTGALNGTNIVILGTNFPAYLFDSFAKARVESIQNASISNVVPVSVWLGRAKQSLTTLK